MRHGQRRRHYHAIFTCFKCASSGSCLPLRSLVENNVRFCLQQLSRKVKFIDVPCDVLGTNEYGLPYLSEIFEYAYEEEPFAITYTYANADILFDTSFLATVQAIIQKFHGKEFIATGRRTNVNWTLAQDLQQPDFDFDVTYRQGSLFREDALDYFVTTPDSILWYEVPDFVIGRPAFDNWLVNYAAEREILVDTSKTLRAIHQSVDHDTRHWEDMAAGPDLNFNRNLAVGKFESGYTWRAQWQSEHSLFGIYLCQKSTPPASNRWAVYVCVATIASLTVKKSGKRRITRRRRRNLLVRFSILFVALCFLQFMYTAFILVSKGRYNPRDVDGAALVRQTHDVTLRYIDSHDIVTLHSLHAQFGFIFVMFVDNAFLEMTLNWLCHAPTNVIQKTAFFTPSGSQTNSLVELGAIHVFSIGNASRKSASAASYGQKYYYELINERGKAIQELLRANLNVWLIESDSTWFADPSFVLRQYENFDIILGQDGALHEEIPEAGFIFLNNTRRTRLLWRMTIEWQARQLNTLVDGEVGDLGNEMLQLPNLLKDTECKWTFFPVKHFVSGKWYLDWELRSNSDPIVIQNNWLIGVEKKISRAKSWGHWYLQPEDGKSCTRRLFA